MPELYSGVKVVTVNPEIINEIYKEKKIKIFDNRYSWYENMFVVLKDEFGGQQSALGRVRGEHIHLLPERSSLNAQGITPKNKEQQMAMDVLLDDSVRVVVLTGVAGSGKTILTLSAALQKVQEKKYTKVILTRPMSNVGKYQLGALPGDVSEKLMPYMDNFMCNLDFMIKGGRKNIQDLIDLYNLEFIPMQLIRGSSWHNAFVIVDEVQILDYHEILTLGTRVAEGSKLVILGDLAQRDEKIAIEKTGMFYFVNHEDAKNSPMVSTIRLIKSERGEVAMLFAKIFDAE